LAEDFDYKEAGVSATSWPPTPAGDVIGCRAWMIPKDAIPVFDDDRQLIVGWQSLADRGWITTYAVDGAVVTRREQDLKEPLIDPIDIILIVGGVVRALIKGAAAGGARLIAARATARLGAAQFSRYEAAALSAKIAAAEELPLLFTKTIIPHFRELSIKTLRQSRFVPLQIIKLAVKYGTRTPDPDGVVGIFRYAIPMVKNGKTYELEVLLREADRTVVHFEYKP
jgi:hypothetical protein